MRVILLTFGLTQLLAGCIIYEFEDNHTVHDTGMLDSGDLMEDESPTRPDLSTDPCPDDPGAEPDEPTDPACVPGSDDPGSDPNNDSDPGTACRQYSAQNRSRVRARHGDEAF